jgi:hypothetical protein
MTEKLIQCEECGTEHVTDQCPAKKKRSTVGWTKPNSMSKKFHYIGEDGRSLCCRYLMLAIDPAQMEAEVGMRSPDDCSACRKKLEAARAKAVSK